ncbi:hypothetical protein CCACVL1_17601, partial [Corchorus capsularis]
VLNTLAPPLLAADKKVNVALMPLWPC